MLELVDPCGEKATTAVGYVPRLRSLEGQVIGLLSNGKPNAPELLRAIGNRLVADYGARDLIALDTQWQGEQSLHFIAPEWMIDRLAAETTAVITGHGD